MGACSELGYSQLKTHWSTLEHFLLILGKSLRPFHFQESWIAPSVKVHERIAELRKHYRILLWPLVLLLGIALYPFKTTIVPEWDLRVVDSTNAAVPSINVTEHWQHYLFDREAQEDVRTTREDGRVSFPARSMRASLLHRAFATIVKVSRYA
jgi:hypothetical protein